MPYVFHSAITTGIDEARGARTYRYSHSSKRMVPVQRHHYVGARARACTRPLSRERSKSKSTSQPIVNTGTTSEFNSIRTRSSDCSIARHRIPPARSRGHLPSLSLFTPPDPLPLLFPPSLACHSQRSHLLPSPGPLIHSVRTDNTRSWVQKRTHSVPLASVYLPVRFYPMSLAKARMYTQCAESASRN